MANKTKKKLEKAEDRRHNFEESKKTLLEDQSKNLIEKLHFIQKKKKDNQDGIYIKNLTAMNKQMLFISQSVEKDMNTNFYKQNVL